MTGETKRPPDLVVAVIIELERGPLVPEPRCLLRELRRSEVAFLEPEGEPPRYPDPGKGTDGFSSRAVTRALRVFSRAVCASRSLF
jgi:hypothetical protein